MGRRISGYLFRLLAIWILFASCLMPAQANESDGIEISKAALEYSAGVYRLSLAYAFDLTPALVDALSRGVPLYFTTDVLLTRPRWYWFDEQAMQTSRTTRISYNVLTRKYHVLLDGSLQQSFPTLDEALAMVKRPPRWELGPRSMLVSGEVYELSVRMGLDVARLPKPLQVHAINSSGWRFSSDWKQFSFRAE